MTERCITDDTVSMEEIEDMALLRESVVVDSMDSASHV